MSKREKNAATLAGAAVVILLLNYAVVNPLMDRKDRLDNANRLAEGEYAAKLNLVKRSKEDSPRWNEIMRSGLLKDVSGAEGQAYSAVTSWAREAGLNPPPALKTDHTEKDGKDFYKLTIRATANANMEQISRFLWHFETATVPIRITELNITSRKEGTDDLALQMSFTTIYMATDNDNATNANKSVAMATEVRP